MQLQFFVEFFVRLILSLAPTQALAGAMDMEAPISSKVVVVLSPIINLLLLNNLKQQAEFWRLSSFQLGVCQSPPPH